MMGPVPSVTAAVLFTLSLSTLCAGKCPGAVTIEVSLKDAVTCLYDAILEHRPEDAAFCYHSESPEISRVRAEIEQAEYLQRTTTLSFQVTGLHNDFAYAKAKHHILRIAGIKFFERSTEVSYVFRKQGDAWKLWATRLP